MDLETIEKILHAKLPQVKLKGKTSMTYNLYLGILDQMDKLHKYNELQAMYDNMYKSNVEMAGQIKDLKEQLRKSNELNSIFLFLSSRKIIFSCYSQQLLHNSGNHHSKMNKLPLLDDP